MQVSQLSIDMRKFLDRLDSFPGMELSATKEKDDYKSLTSTLVHGCWLFFLLILNEAELSWSHVIKRCFVYTGSTIMTVEAKLSLVQILRDCWTEV